MNSHKEWRVGGIAVWRVLRQSGLLLGGLLVTGVAFARPAYDCACLVNKVNFDVKYESQWGDQPWKSQTLQKGGRVWFCYNYEEGQRQLVQPLRVRLDVDLSKGSSVSTFRLPTAPAGQKTCEHVVPESTFHFAYRANTNQQYMTVSKSQADPRSSLSRPQPSPYPRMSGPEVNGPPPMIRDIPPSR
jgi:hypothetical protein